MACPVIEYNSYTFPNVYGPYSFSQTPVGLRFTCNFLLTESSSANLINAENTMLAAVKVVKGRLKLTFNGTSEADYKHETTGGTGFNARATVSKIENATLATALSRPFSLSVELELPYTQDSGRIQADMDISYSPARQVVAKFSILYSASTTQNALAVYQADNWATTMLSALFSGDVFEKVSENYSQDQNQKRLKVNVQYRQIIFAISADSTVNSKVVEGKLTYALRFQSQVNAMITSTTESRSLLVLDLSYTGFFDRTLVTTPDGMSDIWQKYLRGRLIGQATTILKPATYDYANPTYFIQDERLSIDTKDFSISASMSIGCVLSGIHIISVDESIQIILDENIAFNKLWDGKESTYAFYTKGKTRSLNRTVVMTRYNEPPSIPDLPKNYGVSEGEWMLLRQIKAPSMKYVGINFSGSDPGSAKEVAIYTMRLVESYLHVRLAESVKSVVGEVSSQSNTGV